MAAALRNTQHVRVLLATVQSAKAALAAAVENTEGVREAVAAKEVLEAAQKSSTAAWRAHSVSSDTALSPSLRHPVQCGLALTVDSQYPASSAP